MHTYKLTPKLPLQFREAGGVIPQGLGVIRRNWHLPFIGHWKRPAIERRTITVDLSADAARDFKNIQARTRLSQQDICLSALLMAGQHLINPHQEITAELPTPALYAVDLSGRPGKILSPRRLHDGEATQCPVYGVQCDTPCKIPFPDPKHHKPTGKCPAGSS